MDELHSMVSNAEPLVEATEVVGGELTSSAWKYDPLTGGIQLDHDGSSETTLQTHPEHAPLATDTHIHRVSFDPDQDYIAALQEGLLLGTSADFEIDSSGGVEGVTYADLVLASVGRFCFQCRGEGHRINLIQPVIIEAVDTNIAEQILDLLRSAVPTELHPRMITSPVSSRFGIFSGVVPEGQLPLVVVTHSRIRGEVPRVYRHLVLYPSICNPLNPDIALAAVNNRYRKRPPEDEIVTIIEPRFDGGRELGFRTTLHALGVLPYSDPYTLYRSLLNRLRRGRIFGQVRDAGGGSIINEREVGQQRNLGLIRLDTPSELYLIC